MEPRPLDRIRELRSALGAYLKTYRGEYLLAIKEYLSELKDGEALKLMGCDEKCRGCYLGHEELPQGFDPCRMWAMHEALQGVDVKQTKNPRVITLAKELLEALEKK